MANQTNPTNQTAKAKTRRPTRSGVLLIDKPKGLTSHDVVRDVRRAFGQREVGHTGTLDPMATGLMVVLLGKATRLAQFVEATQKRYTGTVTLGRSTTTFDAEGETVEEVEIDVASDRIGPVLGSLVGEIEQSVPIYSAVKVDGERLYKKARKGEVVETPVRRIRIHRLTATRIALPDVEIDVCCSKGTYIRTLAVQIGTGLGVPAHLSSLRRTEVGSFSVEDGIEVDVLTGSDAELRPIREAITHMPSLCLEGPATADVAHGRPLRVGQVRGLLEMDLGAQAPVALLDGSGELLAVGRMASSSSALRDAPDSDRAVGYACVLPADRKR